MKTYLLSVFALLIVGRGNRHSQQTIAAQSIETGTSDSTEEQITEEKILKYYDSMSNVAGGKSLNDIRFGGWTDKEWCDNDYFRTLRTYIDACYKREIKDEVLEPYKFALNGKFAIYNAEPCIAGGMFIYFVFLDAPNKIFNTWIYSYVDEDTETIVDYQVRGMKMLEGDPELTKEEILSFIEEHPENKLW